MKHIIIYTDGACRGNPGPGGWGALLRYKHHEKKLYGSEPHTTNNRMELMAAIKAIASLQEACKIDLYTDSKYVQKGITEWLPMWLKRNWKTLNKKPVKNADLWEELIKICGQHQVNWHWVKGHSGHIENDLVDGLANLAVDELMKGG